MKILLQPITFLLAFSSLMIINSLSAQDLIERNRNGLSITNLSKGNEIAKFVKRNWNRSTSRNTYEIFAYGDQTIHSRLNAPVREAVYLNLRKDDLTNLLKSKPNQFSLNIPVDANSFIQLDLIQVEITTDNFEITLSDGSNAAVDDMIFYRGIVNGDPSSWAAISVFESDVEGIIVDGEGNYVLGKIEGIDQFTLYNDRKVIEPRPFSCLVGDNTFSTPETITREVTKSSSRSSVGTSVKIYFELDYYSYQQFSNDVTAATNYVMGVFNAVQAVYQAEMIDIEMAGLKIWTTQDSYGGTNGANCGTVLNTFSTAMGAAPFVGTNANSDANLAHLITAVGAFGSICGQGYLNCSCGTPASVCNQPAFCNSNFANAHAYSQTFTSYNSYPTHSETVSIVSHELGHNFGSPHTHACAWNGNNTAIDGCQPSEPQIVYGASCSSSTANCSNGPIPPANGGTIMSYCNFMPSVGILISNGFGQQPGDLIRANVAAATCLTPTSNLCSITSISGSAVNCSSSISSFTLTATVASGSGNYRVIENASGTVVGSSSGPSNGNISIGVNLSGSSNNRTLNFTVQDINENTCSAVINSVFIPACSIPNNCTVNTRNITGNPSPMVYDATQTITTSGAVNVSGTTTFVAGNSITLNAGFCTAPGSDFLAFIKVCGPLQNEEPNLELLRKLPVNKDFSIRPNPLTSKTSFVFTIETASPILIQIYNVNGQLVDQVIREQSMEKGQYIIDYDASNLEGGMFHVVLNTKNNLHTKKMIVIK